MNERALSTLLITFLHTNLSSAAPNTHLKIIIVTFALNEFSQLPTDL